MSNRFQKKTFLEGLEKEYPWEKHIAIVLLILVGLYIIWAASPVWKQQRLNDDSFITLTYSKNLVQGNGFVYNHPPPTLGTTSPLFALLTALMASILPSLGVIKSAVVLSIVPCIATGIVLYLIAVHLKWRPLSGVIIAIVPITVINGTWLWFIGSETWLFQFLLVLSFYLCLVNRPILAGTAIVLLFLTRGEGALVGIILTGYLFVTKKRILTHFIIAGISLFIIWATYAYITFGAIVPNTLTAKASHQEFFLNHGKDYGFLPTMVRLLPQWLDTFKLDYILGANIFFIAIILGLCGIFINRQWVWYFFPIWGLSYFTAYTIINPSTYPWYALHLYFTLEVLAGLGIGLVFKKALDFSRAKRLTIEIAGSVLILLVLIPNIYRGVNSVLTYTGDNRAITYRAVTDWLNGHTKAEDGIACIEVGYLGYFSENRIIDLAGLTDPLIASNIAKNGFAWGFWHYQPEYFLDSGFVDEIWLASDRSAANQYEEVARFPRGPEYLVLFKRVK